MLFTGIDTALYMVSRLADEATARRVQWMIQYDPQPPFGGIDYQHMKLFPRLLRGIFTLMAPLYTSKARRLTLLEGKATTAPEEKNLAPTLSACKRFETTDDALCLLYVFIRTGRASLE